MSRELYAQWSEEHFGGADLKDPRLKKEHRIWVL